MNEADLRAKAEKAAREYYVVYGKFPERIGIPYSYPGSVPPSIVLMKLESGTEEVATYTRHCIPFEPVGGPGIQWNEVYLPVPGSEQGMQSGAAVAKMAREFVV